MMCGPTATLMGARDGHFGMGMSSVGKSPIADALLGKKSGLKISPWFRN